MCYLKPVKYIQIVNIAASGVSRYSGLKIKPTLLE